MYLSNVDLRRAIEEGALIFDPRPETYDATSIDLHLDKVEEAKIWDIEKYVEDQGTRGSKRPELRIGKYKLAKFSKEFLRSPPEYNDTSLDPVQKRVKQIIVRSQGFVLWQTKETIGTPLEDAQLICFIDGKSTRARTGIVVHLTAPTIHSAWNGKITLEIVNLGPFDLVLQEDDVIAQLTVAKIASPPDRKLAASSVTHGQTAVDGTN